MYFSIEYGKYLLILLNVDDLIVTGNNQQEIRKIEKKLIEKFEMIRMGYATLYLRAELTYTLKGIYVHQ